MTTVAFVTSHDLRDGYFDDQAAKAALEARDVRVVPAVWADATVRWGDFDLVVLRSPWDWYENAAAFARWLESLEASGVRFENRMARRFLEKTYLRDAEARGARVIPTEWVERGDARTLASIVAARGFARAVLKPALSANAHRTVLFDAAHAAAYEAHFRSIVAEGRAMVQPFFPEVQDPGEWAFLFFDGTFSHALRKVAKSGDFRVQTDHGGAVHFEPSPQVALVEQAKAALVAATGDDVPLYARVDGVVRDGLLYAMELELVEPELFFRTSVGAANRFAEAIVRRIRRTRTP